MGDVPDFNKQFHNLQGDLLGERLHNFYKLLKTPSLFKNEQQLNDALKNIKPSTYQEHVFYINTLIYFKRTSDLLEVLKSGNDVFISKILKEPWFFEEVFKDVDSEKLVNDFLPCLSYSVKKKFLSRLSKCWNVNKMDMLYDALEEKYGLTIAVPILHKCSLNKIQKVLLDNEIVLRPSQVLQLIEIYEDFFESYVNHVRNITHQTYSEQKVLNCVVKKNPTLYLKLQKESKIISHRLSRRLTKKIVPIVKEDLITNSQCYLRFLHKAATVRKLGPDFRELYKALFPTKIRDLHAYMTSNVFLKFYPRKQRWNLFLQTSNEVFPDLPLEKILVEFSSQRYQLATLDPPKDVYQKWAEGHYKKQEGNFVEFLKHYEPAIGIPIIKERINVTSEIYQRRMLVTYMLESCAEYEDLDKLEEVLKYICVRHRNEDPDTRSSFLERIDGLFKLEKLNETHWKYINEQIQILRLQKCFNFFGHVRLIEKYLEYLFVHNLDSKDALYEYVNDLIDNKYDRLLDLGNKLIEQSIYREIARRFGEIVSEAGQLQVLNILLNFTVTNPKFGINLATIPLTKTIFYKNSDFSRYEIEIVSKTVLYNMFNPQHPIDIDDNKIVKYISAIIEDKKEMTILRQMKDFLLKKERSKLANDILLLYFNDYLNDYPNFLIINWFLQKEPRYLLPYFDQIARLSSSRYTAQINFKIIKSYSHLNYDKNICSLYKETLLSENAFNTIIMTALSILLSTEELKDLVDEHYLPKTDKLDLQDPELKKLYNIQCDILKVIANVPDPYKLLPTIMKFCKGDYLQTALRALYKSFYRSPERVLYSYIEQLSNTAVSVRKHSVFLSCALLDKQHTLNLLKNTSETNVSSQKHLLSATLKYFLKNPSQGLLEKIIDSFDSIDKNDKETLESLGNISIPKHYRAYYIEKCWKFFEKLQATSDVKVNDYLSKLLKNLTGELLMALSKSFITDIVNNYFIVSERLNNIDGFVITILNTLVSDRLYYFDLTFNLLATADIKTPCTFFQAFIAFKERNVDFVHLFSQYWKKYFPLTDYLNANIVLDLYTMKMSNSIEDFSVKVVEYLETLINDLGHFVYGDFVSELNTILWDLLGDSQFVFLLEMLKNKLDAINCVLVLDLLSFEDAVKEYSEIMNILGQVDIPIVRAKYRQFLLNH